MYLHCTQRSESKKKKNPITTPKYLEHQQATVCCYVGKTVFLRLQGRSVNDTKQ